MAQRTALGFLSELEDAKEKLEAFVDQVRRGKISYYKELAGKLRVIYIKKSGTAPLLKQVADGFSFDLLVWCSYSMAEQFERGLAPDFMKGCTLIQLNSVITWLEGGQRQLDVFKAIETKEVEFRGRSLSYKEIIENVADKTTMHVDSTLDDDHLALHDECGLLLGGLPPAQRAIYDTARTTITIIEGISDFVKNGTGYSFIRPRAYAFAPAGLPPRAPIRVDRASRRKGCSGLRRNVRAHPTAATDWRLR